MSGLGYFPQTRALLADVTDELIADGAIADAFRLSDAVISELARAEHALLRLEAEKETA